MKRLTLILLMASIIVAGFVIAQTIPTYIPENINLGLNFNVAGHIQNQTFGRCLIGDNVKVKLIGQYNEINNTFDYSTSANFGNCVQGMGTRRINLNGITTQTQFLTALRNDITTRFNELYSARTTLNNRRIITGN